jgi:hypothetical protein
MLPVDPALRPVGWQMVLPGLACPLPLRSCSSSPGPCRLREPSACPALLAPGHLQHPRSNPGPEAWAGVPELACRHHPCALTRSQAWPGRGEEGGGGHHSPLGAVTEAVALTHVVLAGNQALHPGNQEGEGPLLVGVARCILCPCHLGHTLEVPEVRCPCKVAAAPVPELRCCGHGSSPQTLLQVQQAPAHPLPADRCRPLPA